MDEVIGAVLRGVLWLLGQVVRFVAEMIAGELAEKVVRAVKRRFPGRRSLRRPPAVAPPGQVSLDKQAPTA